MTAETLAATDLGKDFAQVATLLGFSDTAPVAEVTTKIQSMQKACQAVGNFLETKGCKSFSDFTKKLDEEAAVHANELKALRDKLVLADYSNVIEKYLNTGKITEATKPLEMEVLKKLGKDMYEQHMSARPVIVAMTDAKEAADLAAKKPGKAHALPAGFEDAANALSLSDGEISNYDFSEFTKKVRAQSAYGGSTIVSMELPSL
jgi:hypothetical protein